MISLLVVHAAVTWFLVGLIWVIQLVHYPSFRFVDTRQFASFELFHQQRISLLVVPCMLAELMLAGLLVYQSPGFFTVIGAALLAVIWLSTALLQIPAHRHLSHSFDAAIHRQLVSTNWIRTVAWSLRGLVALGMFI